MNEQCVIAEPPLTRDEEMEMMRDAVDKLTQRLAVLEDENLWLRRQIESMRAWRKWRRDTYE